MNSSFKKLSFSVCIFISFAASGQDINEIRYNVDTIRYGVIEAPSRRSLPGELNKYIASGGKNFTVAQPLMALEDGLSNARAFALAGKRKIAWLPGLYDQLAKVKKAMPKFRVSEYEQELKLYETYNANFESALLRQQSNIDSVRRAAERQKAIENDKKIAAEVRKRNMVKRNTDSLKRSYDSLMAIAAKNEAKAHRDYNIKKFGPEFGPLVATGQVKVGMTDEMCLAALGEPLKKEKRANGEEVWKYRGYGLKFKAGKLIGEDK